MNLYVSSGVGSEDFTDFYLRDASRRRMMRQMNEDRSKL